MIRRLVALLASAVALAACQIDIAVDVEVAPDGTGTVTVVATADPALVERVPTIADDLVLDDVAEAGWTVVGPAPTAEGGLSVTFVHDFVSADEATNLLRSLGPPFNEITLQRGTPDEETTNQLTGLLGLPGGFADFADDDLVAAVGSQPFAADIEASGATPATSLTVELTATLPGVIVGEETNATTVDGNVLTWEVPTDGQITELRAVSKQAPSEGRAWARPLSIAALVALIAWVAFMSLFILFVFVARWRRARAYRRRHRVSRRERRRQREHHPSDRDRTTV